MANKRRVSPLTFLKNLIFVVPNILNLITGTLVLAGYEVKQALKSTVIIIMLSFIVCALITTTWLGLLALLYIFLTSLPWSPLAAISTVILVNVVLLFIVCLIILRVKRNLTFPETRYQLQLIHKLYKD